MYYFASCYIHTHIAIAMDTQAIPHMHVRAVWLKCPCAYNISVKNDVIYSYSGATQHSYIAKD